MNTNCLFLLSYSTHSINSIGKIPSIIFGGFEFPLPTVKKKYDILIIGDVHILVEVT